MPFVANSLCLLTVKLCESFWCDKALGNLDNKRKIVESGK